MRSPALCSSLAVLLWVASSAPGQLGCAHAEPAVSPEPRYAAKGVVRSLGPGGAYLNIAHEAIAGYMGAMTMSFEPERSSQLAGLAVGDRVVFTFVETPDARRVIKEITKSR